MARSPNNPKKRLPRIYQRKTSQNQPPRTTKPATASPTTRLFGIDFWHAVEFSRIRRAPPQTFRPSVGATVRTYSLCGHRVNFDCQPLGAVSLRPARRPGDNTTRSPGALEPRAADRPSLLRRVAQPGEGPTCSRARRLTRRCSGAPPGARPRPSEHHRVPRRRRPLDRRHRGWWLGARRASITWPPPAGNLQERPRHASGLGATGARSHGGLALLGGPETAAAPRPRGIASAGWPLEPLAARGDGSRRSVRELGRAAGCLAGTPSDDRPLQ
jgi:hypothetical protein